MRFGFLVFEDAADPHHDRSFLVLQRTHPPALRTGVLPTELVGLLLRRHLQGARQQAPHRRHGHLLHLCQVHVQPRSLLAPVLPDDDFSPAFGQFGDAAKILRCWFVCSHVASLQEFA
jgi:hypothetical protein